MAYTLIETVTVGSGGASSIEFTGIPEEAGADLELVISARSVSGTAIRGINLYFNNDTAANYTRSRLVGEGANPVIGTGPHTDSVLEMGWMSAAGTTTSTFGNAKIHISNYASSSAKVATSFAASENAATDANLSMHAHTWSGTAAISSILMTTSGDIAEHTTASLYLVTTTDATGGTGGGGNFTQKATGGTVTFSGGFYIHTFTGSGTFTPTQDLTCDFLVIAGGGGASGGAGGGGGAGGYRTSAGTSGGGGSAETSLSLTASTGYTVTVGAGGNAGTQYPFLKATNGQDSTFATITSTGGGASGSRGGSTAIVSGVTGGSGGGAGGQSSFNAPPGSGTANQGFAGGNNYNSSQYTGGGGGGAGAVGADGTSGACGNGGAGVTSSITGSAVARAGGGGAAKANSATAGTGANGGGNGAGYDQVGNPGTANTGGGAGGGHQEQPGANGGSGIVIVRYLG